MIQCSNWLLFLQSKSCINLALCLLWLNMMMSTTPSTFMTPRTQLMLPILMTKAFLPHIQNITNENISTLNRPVTAAQQTCSKGVGAIQL